MVYSSEQEKEKNQGVGMYNSLFYSNTACLLF